MDKHMQTAILKWAFITEEATGMQEERARIAKHKYYDNLAGYAERDIPQDYREERWYAASGARDRYEKFAQQYAEPSEETKSRRALVVAIQGKPLDPDPLFEKYKLAGEEASALARYDLLDERGAVDRYRAAPQGDMLQYMRDNRHRLEEHYASRDINPTWLRFLD